MVSEPQKLIQVEETKIGYADLLVWTLQETSPILKRLYKSNFDLKALTDHLEVFKLLIMDALELTPQENHRG
ncbi:MAG: hypothetical protein ACE5OZ_07080 [Candidatus Heimdallarchaeota archaeon]